MLCPMSSKIKDLHSARHENLCHNNLVGLLMVKQEMYSWFKIQFSERIMAVNNPNITITTKYLSIAQSKTARLPISQYDI